MLKRSPLRKRSKKKQEALQEEREEVQKMQEFFLEIWNSTPPSERVCYETGRQLFGEPLSIYFHHVLEKEKYPEYKYCRWNIVLVSWIVHDQAHWDIDKCPKIKALKKELINKHKNREF